MGSESTKHACEREGFDVANHLGGEGGIGVCSEREYNASKGGFENYRRAVYRTNDKVIGTFDHVERKKGTLSAIVAFDG